jgi:hypothetical protein
MTTLSITTLLITTFLITTRLITTRLMTTVLMTTLLMTTVFRDNSLRDGSKGFQYQRSQSACARKPGCTPTSVAGLPNLSSISDRETPRCVGTSAPRMQELVQFLIGLKGEGRKERCLVAPLSIPFARAPTAGVHTSPASVVFVTFKKVFGAMVLPVPEPRRIPAQASLIVLPVTRLLLPVDGEHGSSV